MLGYNNIREKSLPTWSLHPNGRGQKINDRNTLANYVSLRRWQVIIKGMSRWRMRVKVVIINKVVQDRTHWESESEQTWRRERLTMSYLGIKNFRKRNFCNLVFLAINKDTYDSLKYVHWYLYQYDTSNVQSPSEIFSSLASGYHIQQVRVYTQVRVYK